jgi:invasion protein IalB
LSTAQATITELQSKEMDVQKRAAQIASASGIVAASQQSAPQSSAQPTKRNWTEECAKAKGIKLA